MALLSINQASAAFGDKTIFSNITLSVNKKDKIGIIGANGTGKTTLFKLIQGIITPESGSISLQKGISLGYLEQHTSLNSNNTVLDEALSVYSRVFAMEEELRALEQAMASSAEHELMERYSALTQKYEEMDGYSANSRVLGALRGLGLGDEFFNRKVSTLSGGEQMRLREIHHVFRLGPGLQRLLRSAHDACAPVRHGRKPVHAAAGRRDVKALEVEIDVFHQIPSLR